MSASLLTFSIILYILSLVVSLLIFLINKSDRKKSLRLLIAIHLLFLVVSLLLRSEQRSYWFLFFFCSGIVLFGLAFRSSLLKPIKIYFAIFVSSFLFFIYSPSRLIKLITLNSNRIEEKEMNLGGNIYLMKQQGIMENNRVPIKYKIFKKTGLFNRTLSRNIDFGLKVDSARLVSLSDDTSATLIGYAIHENRIMDSSQITVLLGMNKDKDVFLKHSIK